MTHQNPGTIESEYSPTLTAFSQAMLREAHVLTQRPELLWQQLYNRLQWEGDRVQQILEPEFKARRGPHPAPWLKQKIHPSESGALVRTLESPVGAVMGCALSPDGHWLVSIHHKSHIHRKNIVIWDVAAGVIKATLTDPSGGDELCRISPDGSWLLVGGYGTVSILDAIAGSQKLVVDTKIGLDGRIDQSLASCAISPDGTWFETASKNHPFIRRWETASGKELASYEGGGGTVNISPDGGTILHASGSYISVWDVPTGEKKLEITAHLKKFRRLYLTACAISPDGRTFVSASEDRTLKVWDSHTGAELNTLVGHSGEINDCAISPDGNTIFSAGADGSIKVWDANATQTKEIAGLHVGDITDCTFSQDGSLIVTASQDQTLKVWDGSVGALRTALRGHAEKVTCCDIHPDNGFVISGSSDRILKIWHTDTGKLEATLEGHKRDDIEVCAFSPNGDWIVSLGGDFRVWDVKTGAEKFTLAGHEAYGGPLGACQIDMGGRWVLPIGRFKLPLWTADVFNTHESQILSGFTKRNYDFAISPDGHWIITAGGDHTLKIYSAANGRVKAKLKGHQQRVTSCVLSPDGRYLISASADRTYKIWDFKRRKELKTIQSKINYPAGGPDPAIAAVSPDGNFFVSAFIYDLTIWDIHSGQPRARLADSGPACAVSPDGRWVITLREMLRVWEAASGELVAEMPLAGLSSHLSSHPSRPYVACGKGSNLFLVDLVGLDYGPLVVTAVDGGDGPTLQCPACRQVFPLQKAWLGAEIPCPGQGCQAQLKINPVILKRR